MYRYAFGFATKLTTTLLEKIAIFNMWNVKQKDDGTAKWAEKPDLSFFDIFLFEIFLTSL